MNVFRGSAALVAALLAIGCASDGPAGPPDGDPIEGVVLAADTDAPLAGATVSIESDGRTVTTGADGRFAFAFDAPRQATVTLEVERSGYSRVRMDVPPFDRIETPTHGFRAWTYVIDGGLEEPTITSRVDVENRETAPLGPISIVGRLDFEARLTRESFEVSEAAPGDGDLEIGADGRSFSVGLEFLPPTSGLVEVLRFTVASPGPHQTICYFVEGEAEVDGATLRYDDSNCLTTPVGR